MLDLKRIQDNPSELESMLANRNYQGLDMNSFRELIDSTKKLKSSLDTLRMERNSASKEIGNLIAQGKKDEAEARKQSVQGLGDEIAAMETHFNDLESRLSELVIGLPNFIDSEVPIGKDEHANVELRIEGTKREFNFQPRTHWEIGESMNILDFERGVKLAGSRFYSYRGLAATLERAIINFMLDLHTNHFGYQENWVPSLVVDDCMVTTGQYPKFAGEFYRLDADGLSMIPTAEVPLVNLYRDEIIPESDLPLQLTAATSCFRREAGAAGRDTRGLVRVHQFQKVELVQIVRPEESEKVHQQMLSHAEEVLKRLGIPYRVLLLSSGDMGATASRTYDLEVWMPGLNRYLEISSVSNCRDYQARRGRIRYRPSAPKAKPELVHTLNGSGLAAGRTMIAIMENFQNEDGTFTIPEVLKPYMQSRLSG